MKRDTIVEDGDYAILDLPNGEYALAFDDANGLETTIEFNRVGYKRGFSLYHKTGEGRLVHSGSLEGSPEEYGAVGEWLIEQSPVRWSWGDGVEQ